MKQCMRWAEDATNYKDGRRSGSRVFLAQENTWSIAVLPGQVCLGSARMACPTEGTWLAQNRIRDSLFLQISFSNLSSISPINSKKEKSEKRNREALGKVRPSCEQTTPKHQEVHRGHQPELLDELGLSTPSRCTPLSEEGTPPLYAGQPGAHTSCATAWLVQRASRRCWKAAPPGRSRGGLRRLRARLDAFTHLAALSSLSLRS